jgi:hypothetical protein
MTVALCAFDAYRDQEARTLMVAFVASSRMIEAPHALAELRGLNHVGLAYVYRDAIAAAAKSNAVDYDPCEVQR